MVRRWRPIVRLECLNSPDKTRQAGSRSGRRPAVRDKCNLDANPETAVGVNLQSGTDLSQPTEGLGIQEAVWPISVTSVL